MIDDRERILGSRAPEPTSMAEIERVRSWIPKTEQLAGAAHVRTP